MSSAAEKYGEIKMGVLLEMEVGRILVTFARWIQ